MYPAENRLDVIIPSYRFDTHEENINQITSLPYPPEWSVCFYLIGDNPKGVLSPALSAKVTEGKIFFYLNEVNKGLNYCRNKGIAVSSGTWLLLLDDDIIPQPDLLFAYINAIEKNDDSVCFAGLVNFPAPVTRFEKALVAAGYTYYFSQVKYNATVPWATGANMLFNREKIGTIRFSDCFSSKEGGDEVEFAIQLRKINGSGWIAAPEAAVLHPWWHGGKAKYDRAFKYSRGNYTLMQLHPDFTVYRFCNLLEMVTILLVLLPVAVIAGVSWYNWLLFTSATILADLLLHSIRFIVQKKETEPAIILYTWVLKLAEQAGYLSACLENVWIPGFVKKFDMELSPDKKRHFHTNRWTILNMLVLVLLFLLFCRR